MGLFADPSRRGRRRGMWVGVGLVLAALTSSCTTGSSGQPAIPSPSPVSSADADPSAGPTQPTPDSTAAATRAGATAKYYVSIGDSYAAGYQPSGPDGGGTTTEGFAYQLAKLSLGTSTPLQLVNFACSGVTSTALVTTSGCEADALGPQATAYPDQTQAAAALEFLSNQRGRIGLVTVIIGGNDVKACVTAADPQKCIEGVIPVLRRNLEPLLSAVRAAVGSTVPIVGLTYPDVFLGDALKGTAAAIALAERSLMLFKDYLNPTLQQLYTAHGATFLDITAATGAYGSVTDKEEVAPYGSIPRPIAQVCLLTFYCQYGDIHPRTAGYQLIAESIGDVVLK